MHITHLLVYVTVSMVEFKCYLPTCWGASSYTGCICLLCIWASSPQCAHLTTEAQSQSLLHITRCYTFPSLLTTHLHHMHLLLHLLTTAHDPWNTLSNAGVIRGEDMITHPQFVLSATAAHVRMQKVDVFFIASMQPVFQCMS